jgi:predicted Zn finger-like uncharacterized protein
MMIACPRCGAAYEVEAALFGIRPRVVQCCECDCRWLQQCDSSMAAAPEAETAAGWADDPEVDSAERTEPPQDEVSSADSGSAESPWLATVAGGPADTVQERVAAARPADAWPVEASPPIEPTPSELEMTVENATPPEADPPLRRFRRFDSKLPSSPMFVAGIAATATVIALLSLLVLLRGPMIELLPQSAGFYGRLGLLPDPLGAGLEIRDIASARERDNAGDVLTVTGVVANVADEPAPLPMLRVSLYDADDNELQSVTVANLRDMLAAGEALSFDARIPDPRPEAKRVRVGFTPAAAPDPSLAARP